MLSLSLQQHGHGSLTEASTMRLVFGSAFTMMPFVSVAGKWLHSSWERFFFTFFKRFRFWDLGLGFGFRFRV